MNGFEPRLTKPEMGNKYYNRAGNGGYATSIQGYPVQVGLDVLANCVAYAAGRFNEIGDYGCWKYWNYPPNAEDWWVRAESEGLSKGQLPQLGAVIVWEGKGTAAGHVAIVEQINSDGSIVTSESGYGCSNPFWTSKRTNSDGNWGAGKDSTFVFKGFIYQPGIAPPPKTRVIKKGDSGEDVKEMQAKLAEKGYLRANEVDGVFGTITLGAVLAFQFENGLEVDGICGPATKSKLGLKL